MPIGRMTSAAKSAVGAAWEVWALAWPTVITMLSYTMMQFVDSIMVAQVGPLELAAQGNGGVWTWTVIAVLIGILTLVNTFVSQSIGAGQASSAARYAWAGLWLAAFAWVAVLLPFGFLLLPWAFNLMGHEPRLVQLELDFAQILMVGGIFTLAVKVLSNFFFGIQRPKIVTIAAICGNIVNLVLNYVLIFGRDGIPALGLVGVPGVEPMGVAGSALATVCGVAVEFAFPLWMFLSKSIADEFNTRTTWRLDRGAAVDLLRVGWPAAVQFGNEMFCWSIFMTVLVGKFGTENLAAGWAVLRYMHLSFMPAVGFSIAATSLVGKSIGEGNPAAAVRYTRIALWMSVLYMGAWGALMLLFREPMVRTFTDAANTDPEAAAKVIEVGSRIMIYAAIFQAFDAVGIVYSGALRGAGDTLWPGVVVISLSWVFIVGGGAWMIHFHPEMGSVGPWLGSTIYIFLVGGALAWRFERGPWRKHKLERHASA